jgi:threonine/homoserine/homoserine lactone efflux protein
MVLTLTAFALAFFFSFIGSIPPGTINLTILQLGLEHKIKIAWRFALAAALIEYPYAWLAVKFESFITSSPVVIENMQLITAIVMTILGILNLWSTTKPTSFTQKFSQSGFRRGIVLGILNPLAMPYWIGITAYLRSQHWVDLSSNLTFQAYLFGVSLGALAILILLMYLAKKIALGFQHNPWIKKIPGVMMLVLGIYAFGQYVF